jgi:hypothetical protein
VKYDQIIKDLQRFLGKDEKIIKIYVFWENMIKLLKIYNVFWENMIKLLKIYVFWILLENMYCRFLIILPENLLIFNNFIIFSQKMYIFNNFIIFSQKTCRFLIIVSYFTRKHVDFLIIFSYFTRFFKNNFIIFY